MAHYHHLTHQHCQMMLNEQQIGHQMIFNARGSTTGCTDWLHLLQWPSSGSVWEQNCGCSNIAVDQTNTLACKWHCFCKLWGQVLLWKWSAVSKVAMFSRLLSSKYMTGICASGSHVSILGQTQYKRKQHSTEGCNAYKIAMPSIPGCCNGQN